MSCAYLVRIRSSTAQRRILVERERSTGTRPRPGRYCLKQRKGSSKGLDTIASVSLPRLGRRRIHVEKSRSEGRGCTHFHRCMLVRYSHAATLCAVAVLFTPFCDPDHRRGSSNSLSGPVLRTGRSSMQTIICRAAGRPSSLSQPEKPKCLRFFFETC